MTVPVHLSLFSFSLVVTAKAVERLYCKRPIQCLASSKILTPPPPSPPGECLSPPPRLWCEGRTHSQGGEGVGGGSIFWKKPDTALYSVHIYCKYFVPIADRFRRTRMGSALSQKLVSTTTATATNSNTTVRFSGLEATAAATAAAGGQQQADPATNSSHSSQGRISNIEKIYFCLWFIR